ncbi:MAG: hypothetical protein Q8P59_08480, partial [Dehalococcoidia bacterium]|nr:hypothetical protein [Dehalococcoidia bacterium]
MANRVLRSLVSSHLDQERKWASWAQVDRQARSLNLVRKVALEAIRSLEAQDPNQAPAQSEPVDLNEAQANLLRLSQQLIEAFGRLVEADPRLSEALKNLQITHKKLESWRPSAYPSLGNPQASSNKVAFATLVKNLVRCASRLVISSSVGEVRDQAVRIVQGMEILQRKITQSAGVSDQFKHFVEKSPSAQKPSPEVLSQLPQIVSTLRNFVTQAAPIFKGLSETFKDDPQGAEITKFYAEFAGYLDDVLTAKEYSLQDVTKAAGKFQKLLRRAAAFLYRNRTASVETRNASIKTLASIDEALNEWNEARLSTSVREAQNILTQAYQKLQKSAGGKLATTPPVLNLKLAWNELESIDADLGKDALMDMSDNSGGNSKDQGKLKDLVDQMEDADPQELGDAIEEVMDKSSSKVAKGKKKTKKTPQKRQKTQKKKKKRPALGDDPWCGKKPTFDSAFKKVNHARSQLSRLMAKLAETSLVRGDVRYALSML